MLMFMKGHERIGYLVLITLIIISISTFPVFCSENDKIPNLVFHIGGSGEKRVRCQVNFEVNFYDEYSEVVVILPFPIQEITHHPKDTICSFENRDERYSVIFTVVPSNHKRISIDFLSEPIIITSADGDVNKLSINLNFPEPPPEILWLMEQTSTINNFKEIEVRFPFTVDMSLIDDTPTANFTGPQTKIYDYEQIAKNGGVLIVRYDNPQNTFLILMQSLFVIGIGFATSIYNLIKVETEKVTSTPKISWTIIFVVWFITASLTYFWITSSSFPLNALLPWVIAIGINALCLISWIRMLREKK